LEVIKEFYAQRPLNSAVISPLMKEAKPKYHALFAGGQEAREVTTTAAEVIFT